MASLLALTLPACSRGVDEYEAQERMLLLTKVEKEHLLADKGAREAELQDMTAQLDQLRPVEDAELKRAMPEARIVGREARAFAETITLAGKGGPAGAVAAVDAIMGLEPRATLTAVEWGRLTWRVEVTIMKPWSPPPKKPGSSPPATEEPCSGRCVAIKARVDALKDEVARLGEALGPLQRFHRTRVDLETALRTKGTYGHPWAPVVRTLLQDIEPGVVPMRVEMSPQRLVLGTTESLKSAPTPAAKGKRQ